MTRQGLPAILSKESEKLVPYWQRELTENPKMLGVLERDVNNAVEMCIRDRYFKQCCRCLSKRCNTIKYPSKCCTEKV